MVSNDVSTKEESNYENINHENDRVRVGSGHGEYSLEAVGWVRVVAGVSGAAQCVPARDVGADTVWSAI
jgi:hypothetical protein